MKETKKIRVLIIGLILGLIIASGGVYAISEIAGSSITYSNTKSGLTSTNVQEAIDELYEKADIGKSLSKAGKFVTAYIYSESGSNQCIMGDEATCQKTTCYQTKTANSCPAGTIILYKVNDTTIVGFNVLVDKGNTMTMQSQRNIIMAKWMSKADYIESGGIEANYGTGGNNNRGPQTALKALEAATSSWGNVNDQTYSLVSNTGCSAYNNCTATSYTLESRTAKARLITVQEAVNYGGCATPSDSCKMFMTANKTESYWTSSANATYNYFAWYMRKFGDLWNGTNYSIYTDTGVRAVIEVSK